jgi:Family of unknown function (DUF6364)
VANLTLTIEDPVLRQARLKALEHGTSVNALVRQYLERYATGAGEQSTRLRLLELSDRLQAGSGTRGRRWSRDQLYEDRSRRER